MKSYLRKSGQPWQELDGRVVVLQPADQRSHELNESASLLWKGLDESRTRLDLVEILLREFDVDEAVAEKDVESFLINLVDLGLVACNE